MAKFRHFLAEYRIDGRGGMAYSSSMPIAHFSINADDVTRAQRFYANVFNWKFQPFGPPGFFMIDASAAAPSPMLRGSLQQRRELVPGSTMRGFECSISVADIDATAAAIPANGGKIIMPVVTLPGIGRLLFFEDPEGNYAGAMQYDSI
jgi:predicted enzyme related to lactoylglutathione lyase